jgi:DDE superfamily endonuclease
MKVSKVIFHYYAYKEFTNERNYGTLWQPKKMSLRKFQALFRLTPAACKVLWNRLSDENEVIPFQVVHLLYGLHYMATYCTFDNMASRTGKDEKTLRKWTWIVIEFLADQDWVSVRYCYNYYFVVRKTETLTSQIFSQQIKWENRLIDDNGSICKVTVDGTDCRIFEPKPFSPKWFSHKFNGPALRYEVAVNIQNGWIVHVNGPFPAGRYSDLKIARERLTTLLENSVCEGEMALADGGYQDGYLYFETPTGDNESEDQRMKAIARARHETINRRLKVWRILNNRYHGNIAKHGHIFMAVANITQLGIETRGHDVNEEDTEGGLFEVEYYDRNEDDE